ncbi:leucine-rich repeat and coiled-coil domain-containing protein 1-like [Gouania willdenowi]|uniref:leucine-rich repeat and coiled-coil domain-containing protein 1-like n=1 Tax=Gouania willdenowi TaxID=441366 RepID=UPI00105458B3|nr:leucine-rich repeat and coiled-coil domain-containing protein 1-like [Gouania willdenowi]
MRMKENFEAKERSLLEDRERETLAHRTAVEKLRCVDDAFRRQLEAVQMEHQAELLQMATESERKMEQANQKVHEVEDEMRQLLQETENNKRIMEEKMNRLSRFLTEFNR